MSHMRLRTCLGLFDLPRPKDNAVSRHQTIGQLSSAVFKEVISVAAEKKVQEMIVALGNCEQYEHTFGKDARWIRGAPIS